jgi:hypothetical protein
MPKMGVNPESLEAPQPVPSGMYELRLKGITCKASKSGKGYNYEAFFTTVNQPSETNDKFVMYRMNNGFSQGEAAQDMCHALGFPMEADGSFPGDWTLKDASKPEDFNLAQYSGVLIGKTGKAELVTESYDGRESNVVKQWVCKVDQCTTRFPKIRHRTDLRGKK